MKKQTGTIKRRLIAIALTSVALTSFTTMTITSASAATTQTTVSASLHKNTNNALNAAQTQLKSRRNSRRQTRLSGQSWILTTGMYRTSEKESKNALSIWQAKLRAV